MTYALLKTLHLFAVLLWVGGMLFVLAFLRPSLAALQPPERLLLMREVLRRFFAAVAVAVLLVIVTGFGMTGLAGMMARTSSQAAGAAGAATPSAWPLGWIVMAAIGLAMAVIFGHIRLALYTRFTRAMDGGDRPAAAAALNHIRIEVGVNLVLGLAAVAAVVLL
jgi:uncharacterized membrane protein